MDNTHPSVHFFNMYKKTQTNAHKKSELELHPLTHFRGFVGFFLTRQDPLFHNKQTQILLK